MRPAITLRPTSGENTRALRQRILRPHQPPGHSRYPGDEAALHFEALDGTQQVGVASLYPEPRAGAPGGWRLRGMAVDERWRGQGVGRLLLEACLAHARAQGIPELWCNARSTAAGFYRRFGFETAGDEFELPDLGPHQVMVRAI